MNPELRRNLWLQMTGGRIAVGVSLVFTLLVAALVIDIRLQTGSFNVTRWISVSVYIFVVLLWGGRLAAGCVAAEVHEKTWDWQRLSSIGAWSMAFGKLIGVTSLTWLLGLSCIAVFAVTKSLGDAGSEVPGDVAFMLGLGVFVQAFGMLLSLLRVTRVPGYQPANITLVQLMALAVAILLGVHIYALSATGGNWYGIQADRTIFAALTFWFFGLWCVVGVYRRMRRELQFSVRPWFWLVFLVSMSVYAFGLDITVMSASRWAIPYLSLYIAITLVFYIVLLFEPKSRGAIVNLFNRGDPSVRRQAWDATPLWFLSLLYLLLVSLFIVIAGPGQSFGGEGLNGLPILVVAMLLFVARDLFILLALVNLRDPLQPELVAFIIWMALYLPLPAIFLVGKQHSLMALFWPDPTAPAALLLAAPAVEAVIAGLIAWLIWRKNRSMSAASS